MSESLVDVVGDFLGRLKKAGAEGAEVFIREGQEFESSIRDQKTDILQGANYRSVSLRVLRDGCAVATGSSDFSAASRDRLVKESMDLLSLTEPDEDNALPEAALLAKEVVDLDLFDTGLETATPAEKIAAAKKAEAVAMGADDRITASGGGSCGSVLDNKAFGTSAGFVGGYQSSMCSLSVEVIADDEGGKKRNGWWFTQGRYLGDLESPEEVGRIAAKRALDSLGARKIKTQEATIVFDPIAGATVLRDLFSVVNGTSWYKRRSFLMGRLGEKIAHENFTVIDDPLIPRGPGSRPFDGEGLSARKNVVVDEGVLQTVLTTTVSAKKATLPPTASASGGGSMPQETPSNFYLKPGSLSAKELLASVKSGFYVTEMMGFGFNPVTGDFSRGAAGFWIEEGKLAYPVSEVTISAPFESILGGVLAVADDLPRDRAIATPTFRVEAMTVAGN